MLGPYPPMTAMGFMMRVLLVEDDELLGMALKAGLEQAGYTPEWVTDGETALEALRTSPFSVVALDLNLPHMSGIDVLRTVRQTSNLPIVIMTARDALDQRIEGLDLGADDYLVKPFALEELLARVRALLRRPTEQQSTILRAGDLELDTVSYSVKRAGKNIQLTSKEFALLEYLLRNPGRPISKEVIIRHVWDYDADILPNTVEVYIKYLRNKIDTPFKSSLIQTVRGFGYKLEA